MAKSEEEMLHEIRSEFKKLSNRDWSNFTKEVLNKVAHKENERDPSPEDLDLRNKKDEIQHKRWVLVWVLCVVSIWLAFIMFFLWWYVDKNMFSGKTFILDKEIIITLLATTTINIVGLPFVIIRYLFNKR